MMVSYREVTYNLNPDKCSASWLLADVRTKYNDSWFEDQGILKIESPYCVRVKLCYEYSDTLQLYLGEWDWSYEYFMYYSYDTHNVYSGDPVGGAILLGNLSEVTGLDAETTDKVAEHLAFEDDIENLKIRPNRNLISALLGDERDSGNGDVIEKLKMLGKRSDTIFDMAYTMKRCGSKENYWNLNMVLDKIRTADFGRAENMMVLACRYPGIAEIKEDTILIKEEARAKFKKWNIELPTNYEEARGHIWDNHKLVTFLKISQLLKQWCQQCK